MVGIRPAVPDDIDAVLLLEAATPEAPHWQRVIYEDFLFSNSPVKRLFVAENDGRISGFIAGQIVAEICELQSIVVSASARRTGLGIALLATFMEWAQKNRAARVELEVRAGNDVAISFYGRSGFQKDGLRRSYYQHPEEDGVLMSAALNTQSGA